MTLANGRLALAAASAFILLPILAAVLFGLTTGDAETWSHILGNRVWPSTITTLAVLTLTAITILAFSIPTAWLITQFDFPGRGFFEWALILPLAMPGYVMAYAWSDLLSSPGPLQSTIRDMTGLAARDYWFPSLSNVYGLSFVMAATLFPYVYLTARAAFTHQSAATIEVARSLGTKNLDILRKIALPAARPALAAGLALALMETAADYGAADFLGVRTLGKEVVLAWSSSSAPSIAARLSLMLIAISFLFLIIERISRGRAGAQHTGRSWRTVSRKPLDKRAKWAVVAALSAFLIVTFALPISRLVWLSFEIGIGRADLVQPLLRTVFLGIGGMLAAFLIALPIALATLSRSRLLWVGRLSAASGYAAPGAVLALGGLFLLSVTGWPLTGGVALFLLIWVYAARFATIGAEPMIAALHKSPKSLNESTRSLGSR